MFKASSCFLRVLVLLGALLLPSVLRSQGPAGTLDPAFHATPARLNGGVPNVYPQPDGGVLAGGFERLADGSSRSRLERFRADGSEDAGYDDGAGDPATLSRALLGVFPDGDALVLEAHRFDRALLRLDGSGRPRPSFGAGDLNASLSFGVVRYLIQPDGKILLAGQIGPVGGPFFYRLLRLNADGSPDTGFQSDLAPDRGSPLALQADGKVLVFNAGVPRRANADGTRDKSFQAAGGIAYDPGVLVQQPGGGKIIVGERYLLTSSSDSPPSPQYRLTRLDADGSLDGTFAYAPAPVGGVYPVRSSNPVGLLVAQPDGKLLVGVNTSALNLGATGLLRLLPDGGTDATFQSGVYLSNVATPATGAGGEISALALMPDGRLLVGGSTYRFSFAPGLPPFNERAGLLSRLLADPPTRRPDLTVNLQGLTGTRFPPGAAVLRYPIRATLRISNQGTKVIRGATLAFYVSDRLDYNSPRRAFQPADDPTLVPLAALPVLGADGAAVGVKLRSAPATPALFPLPRLPAGATANLSLKWNLSLADAAALAGKSLVVVVSPPTGIPEGDDANNVAEFHALP